MAEQQQGEPVDFAVRVKKKGGNTTTVVESSGVEIKIKTFGEEGLANVDFVLSALPTVVDQAWLQALGGDDDV